MSGVVNPEDEDYAVLDLDKVDKRSTVHPLLRARSPDAGNKRARVLHWLGWALRGLPGALVALLAASIPCTLIVILITALLREWQGNAIAQAAIHGLWPRLSRSPPRQAGRLPAHLQDGAPLRAVLIGAADFGLYVVLGFRRSTFCWRPLCRRIPAGPQIMNIELLYLLLLKGT